MLVSSVHTIVQSDVIWSVLEVNGINVYPDNSANIGDRVSARGLLINQTPTSGNLVYELYHNGTLIPCSIHLSPGITTIYVEFNFMPAASGAYECVITDTSDRSRIVLWRVAVP
jgi:hypothetical protein